MTDETAVRTVVDGVYAAFAEDDQRRLRDLLADDLRCARRLRRSPPRAPSAGARTSSSRR